MQQLMVWQWAAIALAAAVFLGGMSVVTARLFMRSSTGRATARPGTAVESSLYGATAPATAEVFDGFSYRVGARFAGRSRVIVDGTTLTFTGPRGPAGLYALWIWLQALLMAAAPVALVWAVVALEWRGVVWALGLLVASTLVMAVGAGVWPGLGEVSGLTDGHYPTLELSTTDISGVTIGPGWADGGLSVILLPYTAPINGLATGHAVSWWGPDERGREVRFALHCYEEQDASRLYALLSAAERP